MPLKTLGLGPLLVPATREVRYTEPTPIQAQAIAFRPYDALPVCTLANLSASPSLAMPPKTSVW
jgi:hypothetical protein